MRGTLRARRVVAVEEPCLAVVKPRGGGAVFADQEVPVARLAGERGELRPHGRRHEERIAPGPAQEVRAEGPVRQTLDDRRAGPVFEDVVENGARRGRRRRVVVHAGKLQPGLPDAVRLRVERAPPVEPPGVVRPLLAEDVEVGPFRVGEGERRQPRVERPVRPVPVVRARGMRQRVVGHLRPVRGQRRGIPCLGDAPRRRERAAQRQTQDKTIRFPHHVTLPVRSRPYS